MQTTQIKEYPGILDAKTPPSQFRDADYLAIMCHEVGTPLTAIIGLSRILADETCSPERKEECAEMLRDSANMLMELMKNMLDSSKIEAGMIEIEHVDFDLAKIVQEATHIIATKAAKKGLKLEVHLADGLPKRCKGDPLRVRQILLNLLSNAVKFTEHGHVALHVNARTDAQGNDQLWISVTDTGIGIDADSLTKIFGKYAQADSTISRRYGGTGLGLSISQDLARLMHGDITAKSCPGMGSHFILTLPMRKPALTSELVTAA